MPAARFPLIVEDIFSPSIATFDYEGSETLVIRHLRVQSCVN